MGSRSREVSPNSPIRSRNVSADSSKGGFNFNSNESLEAHKEECSQSDKDISNKPKKRKSENLDSEDESLNGGYWDAIGVRGVVREKLEKQESIEKEEKTSQRSVKRNKHREIPKKVNK